MTAKVKSPADTVPTTEHPSGREKHGQVVQVLRTVSVALYFLAGATAYACISYRPAPPPILVPYSVPYSC